MTPKLVNHLAGSNPCIFLPTVEDVKAVEYIIEAMVTLGFLDRELCVWKVTTGMLRFEKGSWTDGLTSASGRPVMAFMDALNHVAQTPNTVGLFYHIRDLLKEPNVIQGIIDAAYQAKQNFSTIIFIGSFLPLPPELYNIVTYVDFPLPTKVEIEKLYDGLLKHWEENNGIKLPKAKNKRAEILGKAANSALGLDMFSAENALALAVSITGEPNSKIIQSQKEQHIKKSDILEYIDTDLSMDDAGGFGALKKWMDRRKEAFTDEAVAYGLPWPKGILLVGPPGTGKSHISKTLASFLELPLLRLDVGKVFDRYIGSSEENMRRALGVIEAVSPTILLCDEIDKAMAGMESSGKTDSGVVARVLSTLLTWRQETTKPVFMVCTANDPDMIPPMMYRKGRLDEIWAVGLPSEPEREEIFKIHLRRRKRDPDSFNLPALAQASVDFTGAEIEASIEEAMFDSFYEKTEVTTAYILASIAKVIPQCNSENEDIVRINKWMEEKARPVSLPLDEINGKPNKVVGNIFEMRSKKNKE